MDTRLDQLRAWLAALPAAHGLVPESLRAASDDASFRRYFRVDAAAAHGGALVAMDAPPPMEDCRPFVHAAAVLGRSGISVPRVHEADLARGFLLLEDFGAVTFLSRLDAASAPSLYADATRALTAGLVPEAQVERDLDAELLLEGHALEPFRQRRRHLVARPCGGRGRRERHREGRGRCSQPDAHS